MTGITQKRLKEIFEYNSETGIFLYRVTRGRKRCGDMAGTMTIYGYIRIEIDNRPYFAHTLAFLFMLGSLPAGEIDHVNGNRSDNRFGNLRDVSRAENNRNRCLQSNNKSGHHGVHFYKRGQKWQASVHTRGKKLHLGYYSTKEEAHAAYAIAAEEYGYTARHIYGEVK